MLRPKLVGCCLGSGANQVELFDRNDGNDSIAGLTGMSAIHNRGRYRFHFVCPRKDIELDLIDHPVPRVEVAILSIASYLGNVDALDPDSLKCFFDSLQPVTWENCSNQFDVHCSPPQFTHHRCRCPSSGG